MAIHPVRAATVGRVAISCTRTGTPMAGGTPLLRVRLLCATGSAVCAGRPEPGPADERGLPHRQCRRARHTHRRTTAGDVLRPRRRLRFRQLGHGCLRRRRAGPTWLCLCLSELPTGRAGLYRPVIAGNRRAPDRGQSVSARSGDGTGMGARQHCRVRGKPPQCHDLRRERRGARGGHPSFGAHGSGAVQSGDRREPADRAAPDRRRSR